MIRDPAGERASVRQMHCSGRTGSSARTRCGGESPGTEAPGECAPRVPGHMPKTRAFGSRKCFPGAGHWLSNGQSGK